MSADVSSSLHHSSLQSKGIRTVKASKSIYAVLFPKFGRSRNNRKTEAKTFTPKQFDSLNQIGNYDFLHNAPAILECVAVEKDVPCNRASLGPKKKVPAEPDPCAVAGKVRGSRISR